MLASWWSLDPFGIIVYDLVSVGHPASAHIEAVLPDRGPTVTIIALQRGNPSKRRSSACTDHVSVFDIRMIGTAGALSQYEAALHSRSHTHRYYRLNGSVRLSGAMPR